MRGPGLRQVHRRLAQACDERLFGTGVGEGEPDECGRDGLELCDEGARRERRTEPGLREPTKRTHVPVRRHRKQGQFPTQNMIHSFNYCYIYR